MNFSEDCICCRVTEKTRAVWDCCGSSRCHHPVSLSLGSGTVNTRVSFSWLQDGCSQPRDKSFFQAGRIKSTNGKKQRDHLVCLLPLKQNLSWKPYQVIFCYISLAKMIISCKRSLERKIALAGHMTTLNEIRPDREKGKIDIN